MKKLVLSLLIIISFCSLAYAQKTIEPELQNVMNKKNDDMISVNIILKSNIDMNRLRNRAEQITDKKVKRDFLVDEMKLFAEKEQAEILSVLRAEEKSDRVSNIKSSWMSNYINCTASRDVIYLIAEHPDVLMIGYDEEKYMLWNEKAEKVEHGKDNITENITIVNAGDVWSLGFTGKGVVVAVIDTGVNYNHVDIADHLWDGGEEFPHHGYDIYYNDNDPMDLFGHGTHCAGTVCGDGTSGTITGMAPDATLMCVKVLNDEGDGSANTIASGMEWAVEHHADVLSLSLGLPQSTISERTLLRRTCVNILGFDVVAAIAVGNEGDLLWMYQVPDNVRVPGSCPPPWLHPEQADANPGELSCVVAVGATDDYDEVAYFSSRGPVTWQNTEYGDYAYQPGIGLIRPDVCAPGVGVLSLDYEDNEGLVEMSGTSMATPCVAGVMALMLEKDPRLTPEEICMLLETTAYKIGPHKNNTAGSGRIDALAAVENINTSDFSIVDAFIDDSNMETANANMHLNPSEQVKLNVIVINKTENNHSDLNVVLRSTNEMVTIIDSTAFLENINAFDTINIIDEFEFLVSDSVETMSKLVFELCFFNENNESKGEFKTEVEVYGSRLEYQSLLVKNDDNGNGVLEAGETADLGVVFNNTGNEIAVAVNAILSTIDNRVTINTNESTFSSIADKSSGVAFFNITLDSNVGDDFSIPFEIELSKYDNFSDTNTTEMFSIDYLNSCNVTFILKDVYGDGWNGASLIVKYSDGTPDDIFTITSGLQDTYTKVIRSGVEVTLEWQKGDYDSECSFLVMSDDNSVIYSQYDGFNNGLLYSWVHNCMEMNDAYDMCETIQGLELVLPYNMPYPANFTWTAPEENNVIHYEIYRDTRFMGTTEETSYVDETVTGSAFHIYSIRPVYEECNGLMSHIVFEYSDDVVENKAIKAAVYPNPSRNDFNIICDNMSRVTVYNVMGTMIMDVQVDSDRYRVSGLKAGVYFINIVTDNGTVFNKVVKL